MGNLQTYQAASGAGAKNMRELVNQMRIIGENCSNLLDDPSTAILDIDRNVIDTLAQRYLSHREFWCPPGSQPDPLDRPGHGKRPDPGGVEGCS